MRDAAIISLNVLEIDMLIHILDEVVSGQKIPEVINEEIRQELFAELDISLILTKLKEKLGFERTSQLDNPDTEPLFIIKLTKSEVEELEEGDYNEIENVIQEILNQTDKQNEKEEEVEDGGIKVLP